jgi:hypothetical protein
MRRIKTFFPFEQVAQKNAFKSLRWRMPKLGNPDCIKFLLVPLHNDPKYPGRVTLMDLIRVIGLGEFSPIGRLFSLSSFFEKYKSRSNL